MTVPRIGVCYYPEHWDESLWAEDAARMAEAGISVVRIGEFAWSRIEPRSGHFDWDWLDRAVETLADAGHDIVMGTPSATPPRWLVDQMPDMLAVDSAGHPRKFGSRRHYCFSHEGYRAEAVRIARAMGARYGRHPAIIAWQIDNEYACHETARSYSEAAREAFRVWLSVRYQSPDALNRAWGNVFWSMAYDAFDQIDPPNLTVTEPNPAHVLDWARFSSDQVVGFNRAQVRALRPLTDADLLHNYMGRVLDFDHWNLGEDLDIATWDSYPIGFLSDRLDAPEAHKSRFLRQGDPDFQAFHHDLYRGVGKGRWWVMEQQPGPVNWAPWNPAPLPGMVRLWAHEAFAHGAEVVSYFRWRQAPFGQEQMHAGLLRPDSVGSPALAEVKELSKQIRGKSWPASRPAPAAIVFDYASAWAWEAQPQGRDFDYFALVFDGYRALRRAGLDIDILSPETADLSAHGLVLVPGLLTLSSALRQALQGFRGTALIGPRSNLKTGHLSIPVPLGPDLPGLDVTATVNESIPPPHRRRLAGGGEIIRWIETLETGAETVFATVDEAPVVVRAGGLHYLSGWPDDTAFDRIIAHLCADAGLPCLSMPEGLRQRTRGGQRALINYAADNIAFGGHVVPGPGVLWTEP